MYSRHPPNRVPFLALIPFLILAICFLYVAGSSIFSPIPDPPPHPQTSSGVESAPAEIMEEDSLPYLLYSATDLPPTAADYYDLLYAVDPEIPSPPPQSIPEGCFPIVRKNLSYSPGGAIYLSNETSYSPDTAALAAMAWKGALPTLLQSGANAEPIVLIYHTHGTEAFADEGAYFAAPQDTFRSFNTEENIVAVGAVLAETLTENGIPTVHCTVMHDKDSYKNAYEASRKTILSYLEKYPSIRYILDIHRDSIVTTDGSHIKPVTKAADGNDIAQIMLVVGTDENGARHPNWKNNLSIACKLQLRLNEALPDFARPINLRKSSFLGQYADGAMLVEIGSAANTLSEAKAAAALFGETFSELIRALGCA